MCGITIKLDSGISFSMHRCCRIHLASASSVKIKAQLPMSLDAKYVELILDKSIFAGCIVDSHYTHMHVYPQNTMAEFSIDPLFTTSVKEVAVKKGASYNITKCSTLTIHSGISVSKVELGYAIQFIKKEDATAFSFNLPIDKFAPDFLKLWNSSDIKIDTDVYNVNDLLNGGMLTASLPDPCESNWDGTKCYMNSTMPAECGKCRNNNCTVWGI